MVDHDPLPAYERIPLDPEVAHALMTADGHARIEHEHPYIIDIQEGRKRLVVLGPGHTNDPENPAFELIEERFHDTNPDVVVVEGMSRLSEPKVQEEIRLQLAASVRDDIIKRFGEPAFTLDLAFKAGKEVCSPEPTWASEFRILEQQGYSRESIFAYYGARLIPQYQRMGKKPNFNDFMASHLERMKAASGWQNFDFSLDHFARVSQERLGIVCTPETQGYEATVDPIPRKEKKQHITNEISRTLNRFRDETIIATIGKLLETYDTIFMVYGASHVVMQEPALRKLMEKFRV